MKGRFAGNCPRNKARADYFQYRADGNNYQFPRGIASMADSAADFRGASGATRAVAGDVVSIIVYIVNGSTN